MKELNQMTRLMVFVLVFLTPIICVFGYNKNYQYSHQTKLPKTASEEFSYFYDVNYLKLTTSAVDSIPIYKELAYEYARNRDVEKASFYANKYIETSYKLNFIHDSEFAAIAHTASFQKIIERYDLRFTKFNLFYLFSSLIGFFIAIIMNFKRNKNRNAIVFMSIFILIHSFFIFHIFLYNSNLKYRYPHILFMSTIFSYAYGPLIYFYFKSITKTYVFKKQHLLHLIPTIGIIVVLLPILILPEEEKLKIMLKTSTINSATYLLAMYVTKLISLLVYGYFILKIYNRDIRKNIQISERVQKWQRNLVGLICLYVLFYAVYGLMVIKVIPRNNHLFLYHLQVLIMTSMVLYIGFMAYIQPKIITNSYITRIKDKYRNSGLTPSFSNELKEQLLYLLNDQKIYKENDINLEKLSNLLNTSRHNTSQVINEHFQLNFFELINQYRINEASHILKNNTHHNLNIIDVAYEVGFNNKVTFNKTFKKHFEQTPSQYIKAVRVA